MTRRDWRPFIGAAAIGAVSMLLGLRLADALMVALVTGVVLLVVVAMRAAEQDTWPAEPREDTAGTRPDVTHLTWTFIGLDGRVSEAAVRRLRIDASRRLAQNGIAIPGGVRAGTDVAPGVDDELRERARTALGDRAWRILTAPGGVMPSLTEIAHVIEVVESLAPGPPVPPVPTMARTRSAIAVEPAPAPTDPHLPTDRGEPT